MRNVSTTRAHRQQQQQQQQQQQPETQGHVYDPPKIIQIPPTIVFTFTQSNIFRDNNPVSQFWGLGDSLRGMIALFQYCKRNRCNFLVDTHKHPFSRFFEEKTSQYHITTDIPFSEFMGGDGGDFNSLNIPVENGKTYYVYTNVFPLGPILNDEKQLIRSLLTIKEEYTINLPKSYSVIHFRVGDQYIDGEIPSEKLHFYTEIVKKHMTTGDILCSDNAHLKRHIASVMPSITVYMNNMKSGHIGRDSDALPLKNTLDDLQIIVGAKTVYTYSEYCWVSGFVRWVTTCFDIPLVNVK